MVVVVYAVNGHCASAGVNLEFCGRVHCASPIPPAICGCVPNGQAFQRFAACCHRHDAVIGGIVAIVGDSDECSSQGERCWRHAFVKIAESIKNIATVKIPACTVGRAKPRRKLLKVQRDLMDHVAIVVGCC